MNSNQISRDEDGRRRRFQVIGWAAFACSVALYVGLAYLQHSKGETWRSALGLPLGQLFFRIIGDFGVPVLAIVLVIQLVNKLSPSPEKTKLRWIGWLFFIFLFVWWSPLRMTLFGTY